MSPIETWALAIFCRADAVVFGQRLRPLSLAHLLALRALECRAAYGADEPHEMAVAAVVCSKTYEQIKRDIFADTKRAKKQIEIMARRCNLKNLDSVRETLDRYFENGTLCPEHWEPVEKKAKGVRAPWELHVARVLCGQYGYTLEEAMDCPAPLGRSLYDVYAESKGSDSLKTQEEHDAEMKLKAMAE